MTILKFQGRTLVVADRSMEKTLELAVRASKSPFPVFLSGESGTGKELIARYIHERSDLARSPFIAINCAAIPDGLVEAELFGYERGAFTGATERRLGKFERANGGTLLLDEISEMPVVLQAKLLRVLQEGEVERIGGRAPIKISVRVIAATNRDPESLIKAGLFREDLYYRLNVFRIECLPLRERPSAIRNLAREFLRQACERAGRSEMSLSEEALKKIEEYQWPGNIRELYNAVERVVMMKDESLVQVEDLSFLKKTERCHGLGMPLSLESLEKDHILKALQNTEGNRNEAARQLGISSRTLRNKLKIYQVRE